MSPEDVHNHSVNRLWVRREESTFPFDFPLKFFALSGSIKWPLGGSSAAALASHQIIMELKEGSFKNTMLSLLEWRVVSLPSNGWVAPGTTYLCCRNPWVLSGCRTVWLFDRVSSEGNEELLRPDLAERRETRISDSQQLLHTQSVGHKCSP